MNASLAILEIIVIGLGLGTLLFDLWTPPGKRRGLGYALAGMLTLLLIYSFSFSGETPQLAFSGMVVFDELSLFFKRFFLLSAIFVLLLSAEYSERFKGGVSEYYSLILFALAGMMFAASANDFMMVFVSIELITVTFYILTSFNRNQAQSLEAGVKYLILGAVSSGLLVFGIALVYGTAVTTSFESIAAAGEVLVSNSLFRLGMLLIVCGLGFKIAAFPFQIWAPDVYQGAPLPTTHFLAIGSKAAGFVLLIRILVSAVPEFTLDTYKLWIFLSGFTILYGNLCALPQRNLKRLLGYSSIAHAGYMLLGIAALNHAGTSAILFYLTSYLFTLSAAFSIIWLTMRHLEGEDIQHLSGLHQRSPYLAGSMTLALVSLAGIPPLSGFFGKFMLIRAVLEQASQNPVYYGLVLVAIAGVVISIYYYFGLIRLMYWGEEQPQEPLQKVSLPLKAGIAFCVLATIYLGVFPNALVHAAQRAVQQLM